MKKTKKTEKAFDYKTIKTFEDACKKTGYDPSVTHLPLLPPEFSGAMIAQLKLFIIFLAINNGWVPNWSDYNQYKYFPWYSVLSSGFGFDGTYYYFAHAYTTAGSRLCTNSSEKALYIAKTFQEEYKEFLLILK